jgi:hypothetical protein
MANPVVLSKAALGLGGDAVALAGGVTRQVTYLVLSLLPPLDQDPENHAAPVVRAPEDAGAPPQREGGPGPSVVPVEPRIPEEPPIDVVGQALAAEAESEYVAPGGGGFAHEPRGVSRQEEHGSTSWQQAEADEIADEIADEMEAPHEG